MIFKLVSGDYIVVIIQGELDILVIDYRRCLILDFSIKLLDYVLLKLRLKTKVTQNE